MSNANEIRNKIKSIGSMKKITGAMEKVAASKMGKAQKRIKLSRPYAEKICEVVSNIANGNLDFEHDFLQVRESKNIGFIVISTDRGLCGSLNNSLFKNIISDLMHKHKDKNVSMACIGSKGLDFFKKSKVEIIANAAGLGDSPLLQDLLGVIKVMLDAYRDKKIDAIYLGFNKFISTMNQQATVQKILPLQPNTNNVSSHAWDYIYEPKSYELLNMVLIRYIESQIYQAVVENIACEQAARMMAMKSASDNAGNLIDELRLVYNKARQAAITQEISEICSGAVST